jgi:plasmid stabilization system protein ParE
VVYLEPEALSSAHHAAQWYASTADLAEPFLQAVEAAIARARSWPDAYPQVRRSRDLVVRRILTRRFPYAIEYAVVPDGIIVLAVRHQARRPPV